MSIVINTNVNSLLAQEYLTTNQDNLAQTLNRLSSGHRINDAKDDAAGLAISQSIQESVKALRVGIRNANDGISLVQTSQSAMQNALGLLQRMREIAAQATSGQYSSGDLTNLNTEFQKLNTEIERVSQVVSFNGISLLDNSGGSLNIQVGTASGSNDRIGITLTNMTTGTAGLSIATLDVSTNSDAGTALGTLDTAINSVTTGLAALGASEENLYAAATSNASQADDLDAANSRILDTDYALESSNLARYNILNQSNVSMLAQANAAPNIVLKLLGG